MQTDTRTKTLADLQTGTDGQSAVLRLSLDQKTVQSIQAVKATGR